MLKFQSQAKNVLQISYDLISDDPFLMVSLFFSTNLINRTEIETVWGEIGAGVTPGQNLTFWWYSGVSGIYILNLVANNGLCYTISADIPVQISYQSEYEYNYQFYCTDRTPYFVYYKGNEHVNKRELIWEPSDRPVNYFRPVPTYCGERVYDAVAEQTVDL